MIAASRRSFSADLSFGVLGASLIACAFVFAAFGTPTLPPAPMVALGVPSPLTGMTRSFVALASGDVRDSFLLHPLGPLCFAACLAAAAGAIVVVHRGSRARAIDRVLRVPYAPWIVAVSFAIAWARQIVVFG